MPKESKQILRVIDVNFNRCKEGLRVVEDIFRFVVENNSLRKKTRKLRHSLDFIAQKKVLKGAILCRDSRKDLGKAADNMESKRESPNNILYINFQRVKESLRVLEEFFKLLTHREAARIKKIRYEIYILEKQTLKLRPPVHNPRRKNR